MILILKKGHQSLMPYLLLIVFISLSNYSTAQSALVKIEDVNLVGNKKTKKEIVLRELDFEIGDSISLDKLDEKIESNRLRILSTGLFNVCKINIKEWDTEHNSILLEIDVKENWFIYPSVILEFADRSFNVWWKDENFALDRVNYGVRLDHLNLTGRKDRFKFIFQSGYTKKYEMGYDFPYLRNGLGVGANVFYSTNKEIGYITKGNKVQFSKLDNERQTLSRFRSSIQLSQRTNAFLRHNLNLEFHRNEIDMEVVESLNPSYFLNNRSLLQFFAIEYNFDFDKRLFPTYPEGGYLLSFNVKKEGFGIFKGYNNLTAFVAAEKYFRLHDGVYFGGRVKAKRNLIRNQVAYANNTALGYGSDEVRGYELYVMDGSDFVLLKSALRSRLFTRTFNLGKYMPLTQFKLVACEINLRASMELGYANERNYVLSNDLNNKWLLGGGPALDVLLLNNFLLSIEYNFNQLKEHGLYLHSAFNF